jgi:hypothetical protein
MLHMGYVPTKLGRVIVDLYSARRVSTNALRCEFHFISFMTLSFCTHIFKTILFSPTVSDELVIQTAANLSGCSQRLYMLLMHLFSLLHSQES